MTSKRVVLEHVKGRFKGIRQILGTTDQLDVEVMPQYIPKIDFIDHKGSAELVTETPRLVHYRERDIE